MPSNATRAKVFTSLEDTGRKSAQRILEGVANSKCMVIAGAGVSVAAEIPDYRSPNGLLSSNFSIFNRTFKGRDLFTNTEGPKVGQLAALNFLMMQLRQHAREAQPTNFHDLMATMLKTGRAAKYLTRNFDGLETREWPELKPKVTELHGSNDSLSCPAGHVPVGPEDISGYDDDLEKGVEIACPVCVEKSRERSEKKPSLRSSTIHDLRPAVYLDERLIPDLHKLEERAALLSMASSCQVLLIAGTSLSTSQVYQLALELADKVHESEGVVVFINTKDLSKGRIAHTVDYYLQIDVQACARFMQKLIAQQDLFNVQHGKDIWLELSERELTGTAAVALPPLSIRTCCQCAHPLESVLHPCTACKETYCFESPYKSLGRMCVALDAYAPTPLEPFEERIKTFVCPDCFTYEEGKLYPHLVRAPRFYYHTPRTPKALVLVMYYLGAFWTMSEHIEGSIVGPWASEGWAYSTIQICLQNLHESTSKPIDSIPYEPGTYNMLVVYVTHGVSTQGRYQIGDNIALEAKEFLEITTRPIQKMIKESHFSAAVFLVCGQVYHVKDNALQLQEWIERPGTFDSMVGMLNIRLAPGFLTSFLAQATTNLLGYDRWDQQTVLDAWVRNTLACTHTDMVYFGKTEEAKLFMFSPMRSRPLGRELPSIHMTCLCKPDPGQSRKKFWVVKHRGEHEMKLNEVTIHIKCSLCRKGQKLIASDHQGTLMKIGGLYVAVVPYFLK